LPDQPAQKQGLPAPLVFEQFGGVNTATTRPGVPDQQAYWLDGLMPLAPRNLRTLYGIGPAAYTASGKSIVCYYFYNLGSTPYSVVFLSDGSAVQVNTVTFATTTIMPTGTILSPSITNLGISQWGSQYLIIVANQANGYWIWDGTALYGAGSIAPGITLTNVGAGYYQPPQVSVTGGHGSGVQLVATIANGIVTGVTVINPGSGFLASDTPTLVFTGGNRAGSGASLAASMGGTTGGSGGAVTATWTSVGANNYVPTLNVTAGGSGYSPPPILYATWASAPAGTKWTNNAAPSLNLSESAGVLAIVTLVTNPSNPGNTFYSPSGQFPTVIINDAGYDYVGGVTIISGGTGYGPNATITVTGGSALQQATMTPILSSGVIVGVDITSGGVYNSGTAPTLTVTDTATNAAGTINLMPFGIQGTCVETYQGHVWVFNGANFNFTAPGSVWDFATSDGGGSQQSNNSYLKVGYTQAVSTNGFLFLIADTSMDYISGVQTTTPSGGQPTTTFTDNNSDPEQGTPYPASVTTLGTDIVLANSTGIYVSSGGAFQKKSTPLDGVFNTVPATNFNLNPFNGFQLSVAKATIFGKRVWMCLVPIVDPVSGQQVNKLLMWLGGSVWFASQQDVGLNFIQGQEFDSVYTAWGTDGAHLYPLFRQPSVGFTKTAQSRLWDIPAGYDHFKSAVNLFAIAQFYGTRNLSYTVSVDNETGESNDYTGSASTVAWTNSLGATVQWSNSVPETVPWLSSSALSILPPTAIGQVGVLLGMTITTNCDDMALITAMIQPDIFAYRA